MFILKKNKQNNEENLFKIPYGSNSAPQFTINQNMEIFYKNHYLKYNIEEWGLLPDGASYLKMAETLYSSYIKILYWH